MEHYITNAMQCPPVISHRAFAAAVWLQTGFDASREQSISALLGACERVASVNPGIVESIRATISKIRPEAMDTFEALLTDRRCLDVVSSNTLNDQVSISEASTLQLLDNLQSELTKEIQHKHETEQAESTKQHKFDVRALERTYQERLEAQAKETERLAGGLNQFREQLLQERRVEITSIATRIQEVNAKIIKFRDDAWNIPWGVISLFVGCLSFLISPYIGIISIFSITAFYVFGYFRVWPVSLFRIFIELIHANSVARRKFSPNEQAKWLITIVSDGKKIECVQKRHEVESPSR